MKQIEVVNAGTSDQIVVRGSNEDLKAIKDMFSRKPHLFVKCVDKKEGEMIISFPSGVRDAVVIFLEDFIEEEE